MAVVLAVGTMKGAFLLRSDDRSDWKISDPHFKGWEVTSFGRDPAGDPLLATASSWYGAALHRGPDFDGWRQIVDGPAYPEGGDRKLSQVWTIAEVDDRLYAGVAEAGLFRSDDRGDHWEPVPGLNDHSTRPGWIPGAGGLCAHRLLVDPADSRRMWCAISAVGVFRTDDGGENWELKNQGVTVSSPDEQYDIGYCVHGLVADPANADRIWRQDHSGVYRTSDGGDHWERIEQGLPASFGFPIARDRASGTLFVVPLESDEMRLPPGGRLRVYRSDDDGDNWEESGQGWPEGALYAGVLRGALATDQLDPGGVYLGTTSGTLHYSTDTGTTWQTLPWVLPRILSLSVFVE